MEKQIMFLLGLFSVGFLVYFYIKWLIVYAKNKECSVRELILQGIIFPAHIESNDKKISKEIVNKLNRLRNLTYIFLIIAFLLAITFNIINEIN